MVLLLLSRSPAKVKSKDSKNDDGCSLLARTWCRAGQYFDGINATELREKKKNEEFATTVVATSE